MVKQSRRTLYQYNGQASQRRLVRKAPVCRVSRFEAADKYVIAHSKVGQLLLDEPLKGLAAEYQGEFLRVHRAHLVRPELVLRVHPLGAGLYELDVRGCRGRIPLGPKYRQNLLTARPDLRRPTGGQPGSVRGQYHKEIKI